MTTDADATGDPKAVLFDMDGVLIDSYRGHHESWCVVGERDGIEVTEAAFAATFGRTNREIIPDLWGQPDLSQDRIEAIGLAKEEAFRTIVKREWPEMPGVREMLGELHRAGWRLAVCSSGPPTNVTLAVDHFEEVVGVPDGRLFNAVVTSEDVTRGKPDPQVFQIGAHKLGVRPERCVVVEDAVPGVQAATAARMACVVIVSTGHTRDEYDSLNPAVIADTFGELSVERFSSLVDE
ncbi:MAG: HAD family phosphatase [Planctomycetota bacterium]